MNEFTIEELKDLLSFCCGQMHEEHPVENYKIELQTKIQSMIDSYPAFDIKRIAKSHLEEAESLISHAMCLLGMRDECLHESDGLLYTSLPPRNKCLKCKEFYR